MSNKDLDPRERELREAVAVNIWRNLWIRNILRTYLPFYTGEPGAEVPDNDHRLGKCCNTKRNGAYKCLQRLAAALKAYDRGEYPPGPLELLLESTTDLIDNDFEKALRHKAFNVSKTVVNDFHNYLTSSDATPREKHCRNIDEYIERLERRFCQNSDAFYEYETRLLEMSMKRKSAAVNRKTPRKGSGLRGKRTRTMQKQFEEFILFLRDNPIDERSQGKTAAARAQQFWSAHAKSFERAAAQTGERRGYATANALASAYRASKT